MASLSSDFDSPSAHTFTGHLVEAWMASPPKSTPRSSPLAQRRRGQRGSRLPTPSQLEKVLRKHREEELFTYKRVRFKRKQGQRNVVRRSEYQKSTRLNGGWFGASPAPTSKVALGGVLSSSSTNRHRPSRERPAFRTTDGDVTKSKGPPSDAAYSGKHLNLVFDESVSLERRGELMAKFGDNNLLSGAKNGEGCFDVADPDVNLSWRNDLTYIPSDGDDSGESELRRGRLPDASKKPYDALLRYVADTVHD